MNQEMLQAPPLVAVAPSGITAVAWTATTPTVSARGVGGTFAATCAMYSLAYGKAMFLRFRVTVTNAGTATGFSVPLPTAANSTNNRGLVLIGQNSSDVIKYMQGLGDTSNVYLATAAGAEEVPTVTSYYFSGSYETA